jgi:hypothetical protein
MMERPWAPVRRFRCTTAIPVASFLGALGVLGGESLPSLPIAPIFMQNRELLQSQRSVMQAETILQPLSRWRI